MTLQIIRYKKYPYYINQNNIKKHKQRIIQKINKLYCEFNINKTHEISYWGLDDTFEQIINNKSLAILNRDKYRWCHFLIEEILSGNELILVKK
jgi:hypothetical protein